MKRTLAGALVCALCGAGALRAQATPGQIIEAARRQLDELNADSAASLLHYALDPRTGAGVRDRLRGFTLLGVAELVSGRRTEARQAFREALALDRDLRVDSLADLHSDLLATFGAEKAALARETGLAFVLELPADTSVLERGGGYRMGVLPTRRATVTIWVTDSSGANVHVDSQVVSGVASFDWNLRSGSGAVIEPGRYALRAVARDSTSGIAVGLRTLIVEREPLDTVPPPAPPPAAAFAPESLRVHQHSLKPLLRGLAFGTATGLLAYAGPGPQGSLDSRAWFVGGAVIVGGIAGFVSGRAIQLADSVAIATNAELRRNYEASLAATAAANERARERARIRVRVGNRGP